MGASPTVFIVKKKNMYLVELQNCQEEFGERGHDPSEESVEEDRLEGGTELAEVARRLEHRGLVLIGL